MRTLLSALLAASLSAPLLAQGQQGQSTGPILTLEDAVSIALKNNTQHLQTVSQQTTAGLNLRSAYGALLPSLSSSFQTSFRAGGATSFQGVSFGAASDVVSSNYSIGLSANYSVGALLSLRSIKGNLSAAESDVRASAATTRSQVVTQYLTVLQAQARAALQDTLVANAQAQLELNQARQAVGAITTLEVKRAEVALGQAQVNRLRERNTAEIETLRLFQQMGVEEPEGVRLVSEFPLTEPKLQLGELLAMARGSNPALNAARARESASSAGVAVARSQWLPSVSFSTGWGGYTQSKTNIEPDILQGQSSAAASKRSCLTTDSLRVGAGLPSIAATCDAITFTPQQEAAIRSANDNYPFSFTKNPFSYSIQFSLPIFNGFRREQQIEQAQLDRDNSRRQLHGQELQITTDVTSAYRNLVTAYQTAQLQTQNEQTAREALQLAEERYRVGSNTFVDVSQARADFENAATQSINAAYDYHKAFAELERSVGRPLR